MDNQDKFWLPWNIISSEIKHDMRFFISMIQDEPYVYQISKIQNANPKGIIECTVVQDRFDSNKDFVDNNPESPTYGEMYADYYSSTIIPEGKEKPNIITSLDETLTIEAKTYNVRINGGSKVVYAKILDSKGNDITSNYSSDDLIWSFESKNKEFDVNKLISIDNSYNSKDENKYKYKFKFLGDEQYLNQLITVKLTVKDLSALSDINIVS